MGVTERQARLLAAIQDGLPLVEEPFTAIADALGMDPVTVLRELAALRESGVIRRFGAVVRHRELGYVANAMTVWDVPDPRLDEVGRRMAESGLVSLCYRRPRRLPEWPYNLFAMLHGKERSEVLERLEKLIATCELAETPHEVLFSGRCFKQRGARYREALEV